MMPGTLPISLGKVELLAERPFTHTDHISKEREILVHMASMIRLVLEENQGLLSTRKPFFIDEPDGRYHRCVIPWPGELSQAKNLFLVGFFSSKQKGTAFNHFGDLDDKLIEQIPSFRMILSYSTMVLPDGNYGNLVLLSDEEVKLKWMHGETHSLAVALAPDYYQFVRINNGLLPEGVVRPDLLEITQVKYYDYGEDPPWKAIRKLI